MDPERRLELIAMLAAERPAAWDAVILIGCELLDAYYPAKVFTGYVVALRKS